MTKIIGLASTCRDCPNRRYESGGVYHCSDIAWRDAPTKTEWGNGMMVADIELSKDETATIFAHKDVLSLQVIEQPAHDLGLAIGAGAVYDFAGFLTTRDKQLVLSSRDEAAGCAEAVKEFLDKRGVPDSLRPDIEGWATNSQPVQPAQKLNWSELAAWWESGAEQWDGLKDIVLRMVHPAQAPAGYKWVPLEPTPEMCEAYLEASLVYWVSDEEATTEEATAAGYRAAIAAAPEMKP